MEAPYYLTHFWNVLDSVEKQYGLMLSDDEHEYINVIRNLSLPAASLYVRLRNRKGRYFQLSKIDYPECQPVKVTLQQLTQSHLAIFCQADQCNTREIWSCFTYAELLNFFSGFAPVCSRKADLCEWLDSHVTRRQLESLLERHPLVACRADDPWDFLKFLYFGELTDNLSGFVVQELGHIVTEKVETASFCPEFFSREEAVMTYRLSGLYETFRLLRNEYCPQELHSWWAEQAIDRASLPQKASAIYDKLCDRLGRLLERAGDFEKAMALYAHCPVSPHRERYVRLLLKSGEKERAVSICQQMLIDPADTAEAYIAQQLINRIEQKKSCSDTRTHLKAAEQIVVYGYGQSVESSVLNHYQSEGWQGTHTENWPWNSLFGLLLWDIIYDPSYGSFHQPLQMAPSDLYQPDFYLRRKDAIEDRLSILAYPEGCLGLLEAVYQQKEGTLNPFVSWHAETLLLIKQLLHYLPVNAIAGVIRHMAQDVSHRKGFPDLFLWRGSEYRLVEVKSPNDQLSIQQYQWIQFLTSHGVEARVLKVVITHQQAQYG